MHFCEVYTHVENTQLINENKRRELQSPRQSAAVSPSVMKFMILT
jgi:hypothetical protein